MNVIESETANRLEIVNVAIGLHFEEPLLPSYHCIGALLQQVTAYLPAVMYVNELYQSAVSPQEYHTSPAK